MSSNTKSSSKSVPKKSKHISKHNSKDSTAYSMRIKVSPYSKTDHSLRNRNMKSNLFTISKNDAKSKIENKAKSPPLSPKAHVIDLIKKRDYLKRELQKMSKEVDGHLAKQNPKRTSKIQHSVIPKTKRESSPETYIEKAPETYIEQVEVHSESEDEEKIIEKRRQRRRELVQNFKQNQQHSVEENSASAIEPKKEAVIKLNRKKATENFRKHQKSEDNLKEQPNKCNVNVITPEVKRMTDMFSEKDELAPQGVEDGIHDKSEHPSNWDNPEGYYNVRVGEKIHNDRYTVKGILGQGVFANVLRATDHFKNNSEVAIKVIRNNDLMFETGLKEILILKEINKSDPDNKSHCVKYFGYFMHKNHLCMVLEPSYMDLRCYIKKYRYNTGISMRTLLNYTRQLFAALKHLKKLNIIHADIKPDNILVDSTKDVLKLCDFGSALKEKNYDLTPYFVSRFYRAPEIILGIAFKQSVDIWSSACTIYELATGKILFPGMCGSSASS